MAPIFRRKSPMEKLGAELVWLRARAETLNTRHAAVDAAFNDAKANLQRHHIEAELDADERARAKLEAALAACTLTRDGYADARVEVQAKIAAAEQALVAERSAVARTVASEKLSRDLDAVERALPDYLAAGQRLGDALQNIHFHFETNQLAHYVGNTTTQVEVAAGFALAELRGMATAIRTGAAPIPAAKPEVPRL
jgi:uncharacterized protein YhaN